MKKIFLPLIAIAMTMSCSTDDTEINSETNIPEEETNTETDTDVSGNGTGLLRIIEVDAINDQVTLANLGDGTLDTGSYFMCLGPGTYAMVSGLVNGDTVLEPSESITFTYDVNESEDGLSVFASNDFGSSDPSVLLDYVQWGSGNQARVGQAVTAGRWDDENNIAPGVNVFTFEGEASNVGSSFWTGEEVQSDSEGVLRILNVNANNDTLTLTNLGGSTVEVGNYWLCLGPGTYARIGNITSGDTELSTNETLTLNYDMDPVADGLSVFATNTFGSSDPEILLDYVQWGAANQARSGQAVTAGRWDNAGSFVPQSNNYTYTGDAQDVGANFWE
ncbi:hypothetical protein EAX61_03990 [Dokdonia sinensis]|uniref:Lamin tail domain-containing protein n=1 Tax=Dokdonia sinensis TaxID=2479847 RepID=A0A3M0GZH4_9FLAO|nr:hypothetical protein [Dokdonia sinensis]RMB62746.1 hypothetical protein EAX61_03990 [Dokdonia sinensis]